MSFSTLKELEAALLQQMEKSSSLEKQVKLLRSLYDRLLKSVRDKDPGAFSHAVTDGVYCELHDLSKLNEKDLDLNHQALRRVVEAAISIRYKELKEGFPLAVQEEVTKRLAAKNKELDEAFPKAVQSEVTRLLAEKNKELEKSFHKAVRDGIREGFDIEKERLQRKFEESACRQKSLMSRIRRRFSNIPLHVVLRSSLRLKFHPPQQRQKHLFQFKQRVNPNPPQ
jgi:hypothetical protein